MLTQLNEDGTVNPLEKGAIGYYKLPWAFILAGKFGEAKQIIDWTVRETLSPEGDLKSDNGSLLPAEAVHQGLALAVAPLAQPAFEEILRSEKR